MNPEIIAALEDLRIWLKGEINKLHLALRRDRQAHAARLKTLEALLAAKAALLPIALDGDDTRRIFRRVALGYVAGNIGTHADTLLIAAAPDLLEVAHIEQELQMGGYTKATAKRLGPDAENAHMRGGVPGLNNWRRAKREAAIAKAEGA